MPSYLDRYLAGAYVRVWHELTLLGDGVRGTDLEADARAVACETMRRAWHNIEILIPRLHEAGYTFGFHALGLEKDLPGFAAEYRIFEPPRSDIVSQLDALEKRVGTLPLSLAAWYEAIGEVNLLGRPPDSWHVSAYALDPLQVHPLELVLEFYDYWLQDQEYSLSLPDDEKDADEIDYFAHHRLEIMLDVDTKLGYSGLGGYEVIVPAAGADAVLDNHPEHLTFVEYVRRSCCWGGFPGLELEHNRPKDVEQWVPELADGLMPL
jgi:hypothetical protein